MKTADSGKAASVRLCTQYTLGDPSRYDPEYYESIKDDYPMMFLKDLSYDGERFTIVSYEDSERREESYSFLRSFENKVISNLVDYNAVVTYLVTDEAGATYHQLFSPLYSSISPQKDYIPFDILFSVKVYSEA